MNVPYTVVLKDSPFRNEKLIKEMMDRRKIIIREIAQQKIIKDNNDPSKA
jgi:hypothetical protein